MKYSTGFRNSILRKVLPPENQSIYTVAREASISVITIQGWLHKLKEGKLFLEQEDELPASSRGPKEKLKLLLEYQSLSSDQTGEWLRKQGLHSEHIPLFEQELATLMSDSTKDNTDEIKKLKAENKQLAKELDRKEKALAEVVAILTLKKKIGSPEWRRGRGVLISEEHRQAILHFIDEHVPKIVGIVLLCSYIDISVRTIQRWQKTGIKDKRKGAVKTVRRKLTTEEEENLYIIMTSIEFSDLKPAEIYVKLLDKGLYCASESTMYRILRKAGALAHRLESKKNNKRSKPPELIATEPNQIWMWDITWLRTDVRGHFKYAYVIEDLFDRSIVAREVHDSESPELAAQIFQSAMQKHQVAPAYVHSDNGGPMKGLTLVALLYSLGITPSYSRPRVSDDNPYIESLFKTVKYSVGYPKCFTSLGHARTWFANFANWYNNQHLHSGLQYVTPIQRRTGKDKEIFENRNAVIAMVYLKNPERWVKNHMQYTFDQKSVLNPNVA